MTFSELNSVLDATGLSAEQLAPIFGVGSMTVRRWQKEPGNRRVPKGHRWSIIESVYQLVIDGKISTDDPAVQGLLKGSTPLSFQAIIKGMGVSDANLNPKETQQDKMIAILSQIGGNVGHRAEVEESSKKLSYFKNMGSEWQKRISSLIKVLRSSELSLLDKWIAYGALFYLITPFDLIPDHIPVIGLIDDFGVLGFAFSYYLKRYPSLFASANL
jgi:uncharacterized membrane protein YkvA (DUF1232 family)